MPRIKSEAMKNSDLTHRRLSRGFECNGLHSTVTLKLGHRSKIVCMNRRLIVAAVVFFFITQMAVAQIVSRAYAGHDGKAHVVYANGATKIVPSEQQQVGCENILVAGDEHTVGWSVLVENCCTSYPIATVIVLYRDGKKTIISPPQMIYQWHFIGGGDHIAVLFGPVHGGATGANLYDARSGKLAASWNGKGAAPQWAKRWEAEFSADS
jgi:hypothetical protein